MPAPHRNFKFRIWKLKSNLLSTTQKIWHIFNILTYFKLLWHTSFLQFKNSVWITNPILIRLPMLLANRDFITGHSFPILPEKVLEILNTYKYLMIIVLHFFFSVRVFFHRHWRFTGQQGKGGDRLLFHSTASIRSGTLRHLFATLHVRWLSRIFNRNACVHHTATQWDLPPYRITIWLIAWWCNVCFVLTNWF